MNEKQTWGLNQSNQGSTKEQDKAAWEEEEDYLKSKVDILTKEAYGNLQKAKEEENNVLKSFTKRNIECDIQLAKMKVQYCKAELLKSEYELSIFQSRLMEINRF